MREQALFSGSQGSEEGEGEFVTIAEAAQRLHVTERRLRRLLERPEYSARTVTRTRRTRSGMRRSTGLPPDLVADIELVLAEEKYAADVDSDTSRRDSAQDGAHYAADTIPVVLYQRLLQERDRLVQEQAERIASLERDRERLHDQLQMALESLGREQALRALVPPQMTAQEAPGSAESGEEGKGEESAPSAENGNETAAKQQQGEPRRAWWQWWRRKEETS
jgi:hypothetical protein